MDPEGDSIMADGSKTESDYDVLYRIMTTRMSVRRIKPDPIPDEYIEKILEAGRWAMSGANGQPWEYLVIKDPQKKRELYDAFQDTNQEFCFWMEQMRPFELRHPAFQVKGDDLKDEWQKIRNSTGGQQRRPWHEAPVVIVVLGDGRRQWATVNAASPSGGTRATSPTAWRTPAHTCSSRSPRSAWARTGERSMSRSRSSAFSACPT